MDYVRLSLKVDPSAIHNQAAVADGHLHARRTLGPGHWRQQHKVRSARRRESSGNMLLWAAVRRARKQISWTTRSAARHVTNAATLPTEVQEMISCWQRRPVQNDQNTASFNAKFILQRIPEVMPSHPGTWRGRAACHHAQLMPTRSPQQIDENAVASQLAGWRACWPAAQLVEASFDAGLRAFLRRVLLPPALRGAADVAWWRSWRRCR